MKTDHNLYTNQKTIVLLFLISSAVSFLYTLILLTSSLAQNNLTSDFSWPDYIPLIVCLCFWMAGIYCTYRKQAAQISIFYFLISLIISVGLFADSSSLFSQSLFYGLLALLPPILFVFHFKITGLEPKKIDAISRIVWYTVFIVFFLLVLLNAVLTGHPLTSFLKISVRINLLFAILWTGLRLWVHYQSSPAYQTKQKLRIILLGLLSALFPLVVFTLLPQILGASFYPTSFNFLWLVLLPITNFYILFRHNWDFPEVWVQRFYGYVFFFTLFFFLFFLTIFYINQVSNTVLIQVYAGLFLFLILFFAVRPSLFRLIMWFLYGSSHMQQNHFTILIRILNETLDRESFTRLLIDERQAFGNAAAAACFMLRQQQPVFVCEAQQGFDPNGLQTIALPDESALAKQLIQHGIPFHNMILKTETLSPEEQRFVKQAAVCLWVPFIIQQKLMGFLVLGKPVNGDFYPMADIRLINQLVQPAAAAIRNILLAERIQSGKEELAFANQQILTIQEQEQDRIAAALHDDTIQEIMTVNYQIETLKTNLRKNRADSSLLKKLVQIQTRLVGINQGIRMLIRSFYPMSGSEMGISAAFWLMIGKMEEAEQSKSLVFEFVDHLSTQNFPRQITTHLLHISQEALRNVIHHAAAKTVTIELSNTDEELFLSIRDDGKGFYFPRKPGNFVYQNHFGIISMLNRIQNLNGDIDFFTQPGAGTLIKIRVPLTERKLADEP